MINNSTLRRYCLTALAIVCTINFGYVLAADQFGLDYGIENGEFSSGGGEADSSGHTLVSIVGQPSAAGYSASSDYELSTGNSGINLEENPEKDTNSGSGCFINALAQ